MRQKVEEAVGFIRSKITGIPDLAIVLGSGLSNVTSMVNDPIVVSMNEIPNYPKPTAPMHKPEIIFGTIEGVKVALLRGRTHFYEGYKMEQVTFPVRLLGSLGVKRYLATNAAGGINRSLKPGDLVLIQDHINFMGTNPLIGENFYEWNVRFPDMTFTYRNELSTAVENAALLAGVPLQKGVYIAFSGPSYETPAEIRMAMVMGADVVGMSTVPEAIVANAMGMQVAAISCVSNYAAGIKMERLTEEEVLEAGKLANGSLTAILQQTMRILKNVRHS